MALGLIDTTIRTAVRGGFGVAGRLRRWALAPQQRGGLATIGSLPARRWREAMPTGASLPRSGLCLLVVLVFLGLVGTAGNASAACTISSTVAGASIAFTDVGQTVAICITDDQAKWGLYPALNVQSNFNAPIGNTTGTVDTSLYNFADYTYTTSKAVYLLHPVQGSASLGADEVDVTLCRCPAPEQIR